MDKALDKDDSVTVQELLEAASKPLVGTSMVVAVLDQGGYLNKVEGVFLFGGGVLVLKMSDTTMNEDPLPDDDFLDLL